ncbi:DUF2862 domain-containing protein [Prochlorococcus sp. MIT 0916]|uniref:DUF2862 domain-containing protein n=1 Tax=Prochlorococcus sp. MIT 0916 TaxID=3082521 RepID=UPI0039B63FE6
MEVNPLIPIGEKIKVDKSKIENLLPNKLLDDLPQSINGVIVDYKMTDGMGIGYVLMTENNKKIWIFQTELNQKTKKDYRINDTNESNTSKNNDIILEKYRVYYKINGNRSIKTIANPINLTKWFIFTLKDIF